MTGACSDRAHEAEIELALVLLLGDSEDDSDAAEEEGEEKGEGGDGVLQPEAEKKAGTAPSPEIACLICEAIARCAQRPKFRWAP